MCVMRWWDAHLVREAGELGEVLDERVVERQHPGLVEDHGGHRRELFRHRCQVERRIDVERPPGPRVGGAERARVHRLARLLHEHGAVEHVVVGAVLEVRGEPLGDVCTGGRRCEEEHEGGA